MKLIAILPSRVSSRRLHNKNFRSFFGRPIINWVIDEIVKSELFDKIVVSSDKPLNYNFFDHLVTLHERKNPTYEQTVDDVCLEVLDSTITNVARGIQYDYMCCIYPMAYAITWIDLCKGFNDLIKHNCDYNCSTGFPNEQDYGIDNGGFYFAKIDNFLKNKKLIGTNQYSYSLPMVDINTLKDFSEARLHASTMERFKWQNI